jgi:hypothetical protein
MESVRTSDELGMASGPLRKASMSA